MLSRIMTIAALVLAAGLIAAGCGDDDDDETTAVVETTTTETGATGPTGAATGEPLSKQEFISQGDEICDTANEELQQANEPSQVADNIQGQIDDLRALTPPEGDEDEITKILDDAQEAVDQIGESDSFQGAGGRQLEQAGQALQDYGFKECGT
jgi:hypothetical protein